MAAQSCRPRVSGLMACLGWSELRSHGLMHPAATPVSPLALHCICQARRVLGGGGGALVAGRSCDRLAAPDAAGSRPCTLNPSCLLVMAAPPCVKRPPRARYFSNDPKKKPRHTAWHVQVEEPAYTRRKVGEFSAQPHLLRAHPRVGQGGAAGPGPPGPPGTASSNSWISDLGFWPLVLELCTQVCGAAFWVLGEGSRVQGSGFRVQGSGFRVQGAGFQGCWCTAGRYLPVRPGELHRGWGEGVVGS